MSRYSNDPKFHSNGLRLGAKRYGNATESTGNEIADVDTSLKLEYEKSPEAQKVYEAMIDNMHPEKVQNPEGVDEAKWERAKEISRKSYGEVRYPFVMWMVKERL